MDYRWGVRIFYNGGGPGWRNKRRSYTSVILGRERINLLAFTSATRSEDSVIRKECEIDELHIFA